VRRQTYRGVVASLLTGAASDGIHLRPTQLVEATAADDPAASVGAPFSVVDPSDTNESIRFTEGGLYVVQLYMPGLLSGLAPPSVDMLARLDRWMELNTSFGGGTT
jgi:hypothetical protein